jgi:Protein of unknown function (DUF1592)/Protein of unknown function (DUF1588)/Protein of unknown function (DUF1587)/Protein of unknown function (DUF1585)/Protein of unknown function (DUF1595)
VLTRAPVAGHSVAGTTHKANSLPNSKHRPTGHGVSGDRCWLACCVFILAAGLLPAAELTERELQSRFEGPIRQTIGKYCAECHSEELAEAEIKLVNFKSVDDVRRDLPAWQKVADILDSRQMPPKDSKQPTDHERSQLREWLASLLKSEAKRTAGDPGPVVLRRLNNAEYTYAIRDLTSVESLAPAKEFPSDGAAGEGFTNAGNALSMSPALLAKYFDAAKEVASHAVLTPDGIYFSPSTTRRDWTEAILTEIRQLYSKYSAKDGGTQVNLQGIVFDTNGGGRLPVEQYVLATLEERQPLKTGGQSFESIAKTRGLSPKYLKLLWMTLNEATDVEPQASSLVLNELRRRWKVAEPKDANALAAFVSRWQQTLWRFASVGHIGKVNGPKAWLEPTEPMLPKQEIRFKLPASAEAKLEKDVTLYLITGDAGDGNKEDFAVWERPRLVAPGRPDLLLKDVRQVAHSLVQQRQKIFSDVERCLAVATEVAESNSNASLDELASKHALPATSLQAWFDYLGIGTQGPVKISNVLTRTTTNVAGYDFVKGWVGDDALSLVANSSGQAVRIPGNMKPHSISVHPSPTLQIAVGWLSPVAGNLRIDGTVSHAHPECGNGISWSLELRRGNSRQRLAVGTAQGAGTITVGPFDAVAVQPGDLISLIVAPRDGNHSCDLTSIDLTLKEADKTWNLAQDLSLDVLAGNPHADQYGNANVWNVYSEPTQGTTEHVIPAGSLLARWQASGDKAERSALASQLRSLLTSDSASNVGQADSDMLRQLRSLSGPLLSAASKAMAVPPPAEASVPSTLTNDYGLDATLFGHHPNGDAIDPASLCVQAPAVIEVKLPAELISGCELVTSGTIHHGSLNFGSVQFEVRSEKPAELVGLNSIAVSEQIQSGVWTSNNRSLTLTAPIVVADGSQARKKLVAAFEDFRQLFPAALCYTKIVPVDEVVTLTLYYREDHHLSRLMLDDADSARLERLWRDMHFVSQDALMLVDAYEQLWQYATQDADPSAFEPLREPIKRRAQEFRDELIAAEPAQIQAVIELADQAYRRPITVPERKSLRKLYDQLRVDELPHDAAVRMLLARVLISSAFLYRAESGIGVPLVQGNVVSKQLTDFELASRLSFFLWSSSPDQRLREIAGLGKLHEPGVLNGEMKRMLGDPRARRLATEFACQWLHIYEFDLHDEKSEATFPTFAALRNDMYQEAIHYFNDLVLRDGSILEMLDSDYTFVNNALAKHYGLPETGDNQFRKVDGVRTSGRGGILGMAATMSKQSGASRTSPILRGNWISEVLIGEKLPKPPKNVPQLPESVPAGLTERQLIEKHSADPACSKCHARIDPLGFALENFDAIGRWRSGPEINTRTQLEDGRKLDGLEGLKAYLLETRRKEFVRQFCKKCLGYALGRAVQLSDEPLLEEMQANLAAEGYRVGIVFDNIIASPQFQRVRAE